MYRWIRSTHLCLGLFALLFLTMYGISGVIISHHPWFNLRPAVTVTLLPVADAIGADGRAVARELMAKHGLAGQIRAVRTVGDKIQLRIARLGEVYDITYPVDGTEAQVRTSRVGYLAMFNRLHIAGGLHHDYTPFNLWGFLVGVISVGLILLGATGLYLWFKLHSERSGRVNLVATTDVDVIGSIRELLDFLPDSHLHIAPYRPTDD
ncbi:MAG: hypothetical protein GY953_18115, partial [bacterium]|nr:hypothetical protein [bacterium]